MGKHQIQTKRHSRKELACNFQEDQGHKSQGKTEELF